MSEKSDIRQAVYPRGFHVMKAFGGVVAKCNVFPTFAEHDLFVSLGTIVSDLDYGFQGQKSVLGLCQGFYRMQTKARGESSVGRLHYFDDYDLSWLDVRRSLVYHTSVTRSVCLFCETSFAVHNSH